MKRATPHRLLLAISVVVFAACSRGESADAPDGASSLDRARAAAARAPTSYGLAAGTVIDAALSETISSRQGRAGDVFAAVVVADVASANGSVAIPAGSTVHGTIVEVSAAPNDGSFGTLTLAVSSVTVRGSSYDLDASIDALQTVNEGRGIEGADAARVAGGAAAGGVLGRVIGGNKKGTLIGAIAGAAAGGAVSALVKDVDIVLPAGAHLILTLRQPLTVMAK
ncbi:MAG: glycine zipper 2TM domain-containing protein [Longimicrobiales bacterium]|nr:glycine zipper 2TM domain-containing protein [Longimicrobiales bacterium]